MAIHTFAAIYIGSYEVSLKIFEISARKNIRKIDYIRSRIELGRDAYSRGVIGYELVEALCDTLEQFTKIMKEYQVDGYEAYAAAALRDVSNELFILDQIRIRTGLTVHVLSNSEHRFISYKSVAMRSEFEELIKTGGSSRGCRWRRHADHNLFKGQSHYDTASWTWHHTHAGTACKKKAAA